MPALTGRKALITGASRGIGRAIAEAFAREGAALALVATGTDKLAATAARCSELGAAAVHTFGLDVRNSADCDAVVKQAAEKLGGLDIVVNNAGVTRDNLLMRLSDEDYNTVLDTNLRGTFNITRSATRSLMKSKCGRVINVASVVGVVGNAGQANYAASKGGVIAFTKAVAKELAGRGVTAHVIAPGCIDTDMTAGLDAKVKEEALKGIYLSRFGKPEDIAAAALFLAGESGSYVTAQVLIVDGGMTA
ncbi:MAG: 3-oxoacyl-ACP reductase FabG [Planctomycetes bacterium]|nr:3-oxoacyl-ACP reductase FabG [Planctomycetota bacterium]